MVEKEQTTEERLLVEVKGCADMTAEEWEWDPDQYAEEHDGQEGGVEVYNTRYLLDQEGDLLEVHLLLAGGGPNIWAHVRPKNGEIVGYWGWAEPQRWDMHPRAAEAAFQRFENMPFEVSGR